MSEREEVLAVCRDTWRHVGVPRDDLDEMAAELDSDLQEAERDGINARDYVAGDPSTFARRWAEQRDLVRPRYQLAITGLLAVLGGIPGAGLGLFFAYGLSSDTFTEMFGRTVTQADGARSFEAFSPPAPLILSLYALAGLCVAVGAVIAVRSYLAWRDDAALRETTLHLLIGAIPAVALGAGAGVVFAWYRDFQAEPSTMAGVGLAAAAAFAFTIAGLRAVAVHGARKQLSLAAHE